MHWFKMFGNICYYIWQDRYICIFIIYVELQNPISARFYSAKLVKS